MKRSIILIVGLLLAFSGMAQEIVSVEKFGLRPDSRENATPYVRKALDACKGKTDVVLFFPKGRYDFWPHHCVERDYYESNTTDNNPKRLAILIEGRNGITLDGDGSLFVMHDRMQPVTVDHSSRVNLKNFSVDWDIPVTAQGKVIQAAPNAIDIQIDARQFPYVIENGKVVFVGEGWKSPFFSVMEFEPVTRNVAHYTGDSPALGGGWNNYQATAIADGVVRLTKADGFKRLPAVGNVLVLRHNARDHAGIFLFHSNDIALQDVNVYHTAGLGILSQYSKNISFDRVKVVPNPDKGRFLSGHDDGFHFMGCSGLLKIQNCEWAGLMDDPINIHGTCARITEIISPTRIKCKFMEGMSVGMEWGRSGEAVGFIENQTLRTLATGKMTSFKPLNKEEFEIELQNPVPQELTVGAALENLTCTPDVEIRNCYFKSCRARGLLVSTPGKVLVENNIFESSGSAILIAGDANQWYESGAVKDVLIRNNEFRYPCMSSLYQFCDAIISILPEIPQVDPKYPFHRNIRIENNTFHPFDYPILYAKSVDGLKFTGNRIIRSNELKPFHYRKDAFTLDACRNIEINGNKVEGDVLGKTIKCERMSPGQVKVGRNEYFKLLK